ncbi:Uncharacterised protein [Mycobacterium tuberculosis]|nr:Uncharacterised protein [Mycobacterium tuberculosis]
MSESKPNSWNALSGSMASGLALPSTVAMCERTRSSRTACCSSSGSPSRRCSRADFDFAAANESSTWRLVGALIRSTNIGGNVPPSNLTFNAAKSMWAGSMNGSSTIIAVSNNCRASADDIATMPSRAKRLKSTVARPPVMALA